jgi:hypothetical protein
MKNNPDFTVPGHEFYRGSFIPAGDELAKAMLDREALDPRMQALRAAFGATSDAYAEVMLLDEITKRARELSEPEANQ